MVQRNQEVHNHQKDAIDLRELFNVLVARKFLIAGLTTFITVVAILNVYSQVPSYKASSSITLPSQSSLTEINDLMFLNETKESVFNNFIAQLLSLKLQRNVYESGNFLTENNLMIEDRDGFISSVNVILPDYNKRDMKIYFDKMLEWDQLIVTISGINAKAISEYLNLLITNANLETISELNEINKLMVSNRLDEINRKREILIEQSKLNHLLKISSLTEKLNLRENEINVEIENFRIKAASDRKNLLTKLNEYLQLAQTLGIKDNNFNFFSQQESEVSITVGVETKIPEWYFYGEIALLKRIELLENRKNNDAFTPEIASLELELSQVKNNAELTYLKSKQNNLNEGCSPLVANENELKKGCNLDGVNNLDLEKLKLKSSIIDNLDDINAINIASSASLQVIPTNKRRFVLLSFFGSFMMSIFLVLVMNALKPDENTPA